MVGKSRLCACVWTVLLGVSLVGCQTHSDAFRNADEVAQGRDKRSPADELADAKVVDAVLAAYAADAALVGVVVQVECYRRVVVLKGQVATQDIERRLTKVANSVAGVTVVVSRLIIGGAN